MTYHWSLQTRNPKLYDNKLCIPIHFLHFIFIHFPVVLAKVNWGSLSHLLLWLLPLPLAVYHERPLSYNCLLIGWLLCLHHELLEESRGWRMTVNEKIVALSDTVLVFSDRAQKWPGPSVQVEGTWERETVLLIVSPCFSCYPPILSQLTLECVSSLRLRTNFSFCLFLVIFATTPSVSAHVVMISHIGREIHSFHIT